MRILNDTLIADTQSISSNFASEAITLAHMTQFAVHLEYTGTGLNGTLKLEASNDSEDSLPTSVSHWVDIPSSSVSVTALTGSAEQLWNIADCGYAWVRLSWTNSSGTGTLTYARICAKGL